MHEDKVYSQHLWCHGSRTAQEAVKDKQGDAGSSFLTMLTALRSTAAVRLPVSATLRLHNSRRVITKNIISRFMVLWEKSHPLLCLSYLSDVFLVKTIPPEMKWDKSRARCYANIERDTTCMIDRPLLQSATNQTNFIHDHGEEMCCSLDWNAFDRFLSCSSERIGTSLSPLTQRASAQLGCSGRHICHFQLLKLWSICFSVGCEVACELKLLCLALSLQCSLEKPVWQRSSQPRRIPNKEWTTSVALAIEHFPPNGLGSAGWNIPSVATGESD